MIGGLEHHRGGSGSPLLLLPGIGLSSEVWRDVLPPLEAAHDVLALTPPGLGGSAPLPPHVLPTAPALAGAVAAALDAAGVRSPHVAGSSLGGLIGLELARRGLARSVVAFSPAGGARGLGRAYVRASLAASAAAARRLAPRAGAVSRRPRLRRLLAAQQTADPGRVPARQLAAALRSVAASVDFARTATHAASADAAGLEEVAVPVLIAWGERDRLLAPGQARRFLALLPDARHRPLAGVGHLPMWEAPDLVARTVLEFTASVEARERAGPVPAA